MGAAGLVACGVEGIATRHSVRGGDRLGIYFAETGASQRASVVVYDRAHSAISELDPGDVPWDTVMAGAAWFHVTGITPAPPPASPTATKLPIPPAQPAAARLR